MISVQDFLRENLIFILIPVVVGGITIIHGFLPTWLFLGGGFALLGMFIVYLCCAFYKFVDDSSDNMICNM